MAYASYGEPHASTSTLGINFTGMRSDIAETGGATNGLFDFLARELPPTQGRWISPDPSGLAAVDMTHPQTWNRYAYVANNPLSFVDPSGRNLKGPGGSGCNSDEEDCGNGGADGFGGNLFAGFCDASGDCGGGFGGGIDANGIPLNFGPGYVVEANSTIAWIQTEEAAYLGRVDLAFAEANALAAANGEAATAACIAKGLQSAFSGSSATAGASTGEVGGHWNFEFQLQFSSLDAASSFTSTYAASSAGGWPPPARFGSGPALHLENLGNWSSSDGTYSIGASAHIDLFNPNPTSMGGGGLLGIAGHVGVDGLWGHVIQFLGGNIDPKSCPF